MKTRNTSTKLVAMVLAVGILVAIWTLWGASRAVAGPEPHLRTTGMVGIARGQTFQLNCLNLGSEPILVHFRILDSDGNPLAIMPCEIPPGHAASPSLNRDDIGREGNRIEVRAEESTARERDQRNLLITVEVFNNSDGKTTFGFVNPPDGD
ncbi:MAG TPA: hypothetical protein VNS63_25560 [Blastocatellia bacterium]|nr:hypothetical protein [Blastocatellia bacterium]